MNDTECAEVRNFELFQIPENDEVITVVTTTLSITYEGQNALDKSTHIIKEMTRKVKKRSSFSVLGQTIPKQEQLTYQITNKVKN